MLGVMGVIQSSIWVFREDNRHIEICEADGKACISVGKGLGIYSQASLLATSGLILCSPMTEFTERFISMGSWTQSRRTTITADSRLDENTNNLMIGKEPHGHRDHMLIDHSTALVGVIDELQIFHRALGEASRYGAL